MKTKEVVTKNAIKLMTVFQITTILLVTSCSKSDNLETIDNETSIIYTNIEPNFTGTSDGQYNLDLNGDGTVDFILKSNSSSISIGPNVSTDNGVVVAWVGNESLLGFYSAIVPLNENTVIATSPDYYESSSSMILGLCSAYSMFCSYDWEGVTDKYIGLRFRINGQKHYGWVRLDVTNATQWIIKDYAYNEAANEPILTGQKD